MGIIEIIGEELPHGRPDEKYYQPAVWDLEFQ